METMKAIAVRRSVRAYKPDQISDDLLNPILTAGSAAAMGMAAYDRLHMAVVQNKDLLDRVSGAIGALMARVMPNKAPADFLHGAPTLVIISAKDPDKCPMRGMHYINSGCVVENMMLAAADEGIGSLVIGIASDAIATDKDLQNALGVPDDFTPLFALALGYAADEAVIEKTMEYKIAVSRV